MKPICLSLITCFICFPSLASEPDTSFQQAVSVKYTVSDALAEAELRKVVVDYDDVVHVLSDQGLLRIVDQQLVNDISYRPLADRIPLTSVDRKPPVTSTTCIPISF